MNEAQDKLPVSLIWTDDGHLTEVGLSTFADGQSAILPRDAVGHVGACDLCAKRLGGTALRTIDVGGALRTRTAAAIRRREGLRAVPPRRPIPKLAVAAALALAGIAAVASCTDPDEDSWTVATLKLAAHFVGRLAVLVFRGAWEPSNVAVAAQLVIAAVVVAVGLVIATRARRARSYEGGMS